MNQTVYSKTHRIAVLDGIKGVSLLIVMAYYFVQHLVPGAFLITNLVFFISGLLNFRLFHRALLSNRPINYLSYYKKRMERLFFPMLFMIVVVVVLILFVSPANYINMRGMGLASLTFVNNLFQIIKDQSYFNQMANQSVFSHLWAVSMYAQFILLTPILFEVSYRWNKNSSIATNILMIISIVSMVFMFYLQYIGVDNSDSYFNPLSRLSAYTLGGIVGILLPLKLNAKEKSQKIKWLLNIIGIVILVLMIFLIRYLYGNGTLAFTIGFSFFNLLIIGLVFIALYPNTFFNRLFLFPMFTYLGRKSYLYYLWFYPIMLILPQILRSFNYNYAMYVIVGIALMVFFTEVTDYFIESKKISLPFGQDFNIEKTKYQLKYLKMNRGKLKKVKIITIIYLIILSVGIIGMLIAPQLGSSSNKQLNQVLANNRKIVEQSTNPTVNNPIIINNIEGIDPSVKLYANALEVTLIGDAVLLASAQKIKDVFPKAIIDAHESRQLYNSINDIERLKQNDQLSHTVVVLLGTNGSFTNSQLDKFIESMGSDRKIYFVLMNAKRIWTKEINEKFYQAALRYEQVKLIDWSSYANSHKEWLFDEFHPNEQGALELSKLIANELYRQR